MSHAVAIVLRMRENVVAFRSPSEAFEALRAHAHRRFGKISAEVIAGHVLAICAGADWPVMRAALEALQRRYAQARAEKLGIAGRPPRVLPAVVGVRAGRKRKPYRTMVTSCEPPAGSCECRDYLRSSLGLCKHLFVVVEEVLISRNVVTAPTRAPRLTWNPIRPFDGAGDWLDRVRLDPARTAHPPIVAAWFDPQGGLKSSWRENRERRASLVAALERFVAGSVDSDSALRPLLEEESRLLREGQIPPVAPLRRKLFPYQQEGVRAFLERRRLLLADDMGLGKTAQAIAACHSLAAAGMVSRGLLVVPASLKAQWEGEWSSFTDLPIAVVDGDAATRAELYRATRSGFLITNYEQLQRDQAEVREWAPEIVVLDEAQRIKNWSTVTARVVKTLTPEWRLVLTGTPMENRLEELASILDWVDDRALEPKWRLQPWHSQYGDDTGEIKGARNLDVLRQRLDGCLVRRVREDVLAQLPPREDVSVPVEMTEEQTAAHEELAPSIAAIVQRAQKRPLTQAEFLRLMSLFTQQRLISNGMALYRFEETWRNLSNAKNREAALRTLGSPKLLAFRGRVKALLAQGKKIVVFSQWRRMLQLAHWAVEDLLEAERLRAAFFTGREGLRRRAQNIVEFHDDPHVRLLFCSDAGGTGLNLQRAATCVINLEVPWNPAVLEQRVGRIHRLGQTRPVEVFNLVSETGIEARISATVAAKKALFRGLFDGVSDSVRFEKAGGFLERAKELASVAAAPRLAEKTPETHSDAPVRATDLQSALAQLEVRTTPAGGLSIEAPPDAARVLASLFAALAAKLSAAAEVEESRVVGPSERRH